jgi:hypothetical protein
MREFAAVLLRTRRDGPRYGIKRDYRSRVRPAYFLDTKPDINYQPDVYREVEAIARAVEASRVIDFGCGTAGKLAQLHPRHSGSGWREIWSGQNRSSCRPGSPATPFWLQRTSLSTSCTRSGSCAICVGFSTSPRHWSCRRRTAT